MIFIPSYSYKFPSGIIRFSGWKILFSISFCTFILCWWKFFQLSFILQYINFTFSWGLFFTAYRILGWQVFFFCQHFLKMLLYYFLDSCFWWSQPLFLSLFQYDQKKYVSFMLADFNIFSFFLAFSLLMCFHMYFNCLGFTEVIKSVNLYFSVNLENVPPLYLQIFFSAPFFLSFCDSNYTSIRLFDTVLNVTEILFSFSLYFLRLIYNNFSSDSMIFSSDVTSFLLGQSKIFFKF